MVQRLARLAAYRDQDPLVRQIIHGVHIEGPFISPLDGYRGAHPLDAVRLASSSDMEMLLDAAGGLTRLVTLAPEADPGCHVTRFLVGRGIRVAAGHCNPSLDQLQGAIDAGLTFFTHLGNGCPMLLPRHDNIIQRALSLADRLWLCFIADGAHIPFFALRNYLRTAGLDRCIVTTDAVAPAGKGPGRYRLGRWDLLIGPDLVARSPDGSHLLGSAINMPRARHNLIEQVGLTPQEAHRLTADNPRMALGL
jgi:N-acetylglucosamine-6-phosphate deacetylase